MGASVWGTRTGSRPNQTEKARCRFVRGPLASDHGEETSVGIGRASLRRLESRPNPGWRLPNRRGPPPLRFHRTSGSLSSLGVLLPSPRADLVIRAHRQCGLCTHQSHPGRGQWQPWQEAHKGSRTLQLQAMRTLWYFARVTNSSFAKGHTCHARRSTRKHGSWIV